MFPSVAGISRFKSLHSVAPMHERVHSLLNYALTQFNCGSSKTVDCRIIERALTAAFVRCVVLDIAQASSLRIRRVKMEKKIHIKK